MRNAMPVSVINEQGKKMIKSRSKKSALFGAAALGVTASSVPAPALCHSTTAAADVQSALGDHPNQPPAAAQDVSSVDAIVNAFAESISAPMGGALDRKRLNSLFVPGGRIVIGIDPTPGHVADVAFVSPDVYADLVGPGLKKRGFFDRVIANHVDRFGIMAHVYSAYGSREKPQDPSPFRRGIKSLDLLQSSGRWYIVQVFYDFERPGTPIPPAYLSASPG